MAEDYLKFLTGQQGVANPTDPLAFNPFAEGAPTDGTAQTPFAEELPFRFTQFAINPSTKATAGQAGRAAVARSPFTSGQSAQELAGLRSELAALGTIENPGNPPDINQFYKAENFDPNATTATPDLRWGMPITQLEIPRGLVLEGRSPIAMAYEWQKAKEGLTPEQLEKIGPMDTIEAYDMKAILGDEYNTWFGGQTYQGEENQAAQRFYQNLSVLPTAIDPKMYSDRTLTNLGTRNFSYGGLGREEFIKALNTPSERVQVGTSGEADSPVYDWTPKPSVEEAGLYGLDAQGNPLNPEAIMAGNLMIDPTGQSAGSYANFNWDAFNAEVENDLSQKVNRSNPTQRFVNRWALPAIIAGMSYGTGAGLVGAAGAAGGGAAGSAAGAAAPGLAGALGMSAGIGASTVNTLSTMIATYGASRAAEMAGLPMDNPLMIAAMAAAGGAYGAYMGGGTGGNSITDPSTLTTEHLNAAEMLNMTPEQYAAEILQSPSIENYVQSQITAGQNLEGQGLLTNTSNLGTSVVGPAEFGAGAGGISNTMQLTPEQTDFIRRNAMQGAQGLAGSMQDPVVTRDMLDPASQAEYDTALQTYEDQVRAYERWNQLNSLYEQRMAEFEAKQELYNRYRGLQGRQAGLISEIQGNIASNPFYDQDVNLTGIQSMFV